MDIRSRWASVEASSGGPWFAGDQCRRRSRLLLERTLGIWVSELLCPRGVKCLKLRPANLVIGIGCNRGTASEEIIEFIGKKLKENRLTPLSIRNFASLDIKSDERGLLDAAKAFDRPIHFCAREEIEGICRSEPVGNGCPACRSGKRMRSKRPLERGDAGVARAQTESGKLHPGDCQGKLSIISLGPGYRSYMAREALDALRVGGNRAGV